MDLVYAVALLSLAVILFAVVASQRDAHKPSEPGMSSDSLSNDMLAVTCAGLIAFGTGFGIRFVVGAAWATFGIKEIVLIATVLTASYLTLRALTVLRRAANNAGVSGHKKISAGELYAVNVAICSLQARKKRSRDYRGLQKAA